jgi:hypothetical protein
MRKRRLLLSVCVLAVAALAACAVLSRSSGAQVQSGLEWLDASLAKLEADVAVAKAAAPEHAAAIDAAVDEHLEELRTGAAFMREQLAEGRPGVADAIWQVVRPIVGTAAMEILSHGVSPVRPGWPEVAP